MSGEVLPCPFCDNRDLELYPLKGVTSFVIACSNCKGSIDGPTQLEAIEKWNRRDWTGYD